MQKDGMQANSKGPSWESNSGAFVSEAAVLTISPTTQPETFFR